MKLTQLTNVIVVLLPVILSGVETETFIPSLKNVTEIRVCTHTHAGAEWRGRFFPNGAARLAYGTNLLDMAQAPENSFSFEEIYNLLISSLKQDETLNSKTMTVGLVWGSSGKGFHVEDKEVMRKLMHGLHDKTVPYLKIRFEELISTQPLVPDDEPSQFVYDYDEEAHFALQLAAWKWSPDKDNEGVWRILKPEPPTVDESWEADRTKLKDNPEKVSEK